ncbi:hypothetical protein PR048_004577 [Dryococelus australis]|uniref:Integrase catalytic domain-containing protein n=1 Tax=Dryococelus australis TaxID=614101 RepID=A0ABQ9I687_9NEOP|nr:hypothetical protein PR048_004577 [Dryococelus australis]
MKQLAHRYVYWKKIGSDIEHLVRSHHFLVVVDAKSKWAEIVPSSSVPASKSSIDIVKDIFSRNMLPEVMVSDNAMIFTSEEFAQFCKEAGYPATNGLAERNVQMLKHRSATMSKQNMPICQKVREILFRYRATPLSNGKSSTEQYLNRQIRTQPDAMRPIKFHESPVPTQPACQFSEGECVTARYYYSNNKAHWKCGKVLKKLGTLHYIEELDNARKTVHFDPQPKGPMSDDRQLNKPNLDYLTEIMDPVEQEEEAPVMDFQLPEQPAQRVCRLPVYLRDYSLY